MYNEITGVELITKEIQAPRGVKLNQLKGWQVLGGSTLVPEEKLN